MPTKKRRIGFIPRFDVLKVINKISEEEKLSNSKVVNILIEEALYARGLIEKIEKNLLTGDYDDFAYNINYFENKFYKDDFDTGNLILLHLNGFSFEFIAILKTVSHFIYVQIPFVFSIPIACVLINIPIDKVYGLLISFAIGSIILSCLGSISSSMNLLNKRNYLLGSIIVMIFSIPVIIFSVSIINTEENFISLINVLFGILLIIFAIRSDKFDKINFSIIIGGAIGNFYDRITFNAVPDFIDLHYKNLHWFTFNLADIFITLGIIAFILKGFFIKDN